jgi:hypothetical protein
MDANANLNVYGLTIGYLSVEESGIIYKSLPSHNKTKIKSVKIYLEHNHKPNNFLKYTINKHYTNVYAIMQK